MVGRSIEDNLLMGHKLLLVSGMHLGDLSPRIHPHWCTLMKLSHSHHLWVRVTLGMLPHLGSLLKQKHLLLIKSLLSLHVHLLLCIEHLLLRHLHELLRMHLSVPRVIMRYLRHHLRHLCLRPLPWHLLLLFMRHLRIKRRYWNRHLLRLVLVLRGILWILAVRSPKLLLHLLLLHHDSLLLPKLHILLLHHSLLLLFVGYHVLFLDELE